MYGRTTQSWVRFEPVLAAALVVSGTAVRLVRIGQPAASEASWRETDGLAMARNLHNGVGSILAPVVDWTGDSPVASELPILPWLAAQFYAVTGPSEAVARLLIVAASALLMVAIWRLGRRWTGAACGLAALAVVAAHPLTAYYGRTFLPDVPALALGAAALWAFVAALDVEPGRGARIRYAMSAALLALAVAIKPGTLLLGPVFIAVICRRRGWRALFAPTALALGAAACLPALWLLVHEASIWGATGNTFGIFKGHDKFATSLVFTASWWAQMWPRLVSQTVPLALAPVVAVGVVTAVARARAHVETLSWLAAGVLWLLLVAEGNLDMPHYQLPLVPPLALLCGAAVRAAVTAPVQAPIRAVMGVALAASLILGLGSGLRFAQTSMQIHGDFLSDARRVDAVLADDARVVLLGGHTHHLDGTDYDPRPFYHTRTRGWALDDAGYTLPALSAYCAKGARFLLVRRADPHLAGVSMGHELAKADFRAWLAARSPLVDSHHLSAYALPCDELPAAQMDWKRRPGSDARPLGDGWRIVAPSVSAPQ